MTNPKRRFEPKRPSLNPLRPSELISHYQKKKKKKKKPQKKKKKQKKNNQKKQKKKNKKIINLFFVGFWALGFLVFGSHFWVFFFFFFFFGSER